MEESSSVVIVGNHDGQLEPLSQGLARLGLKVNLVETAECLRRCLAGEEHAIVVIDCLIPDEDGHSILRWLFANYRHVGIIIREDASDEVERIISLELGADDSVNKSCSPREIVARVRAILRRRLGGQSRHEDAASTGLHISSGSRFRFAGFVLVCEKRRLETPTGVVIDLTNGEYNIMMGLLSKPGAVFDRSDFITNRHPDQDLDDRSLDVNISRIRKKLSKYSSEKVIVSVRGRGYQLLSEVKHYTKSGV